MRDVMSSELELSIRGLGGKHGILEFLRKYVPELAQERILVPSLVFRISDNLNGRMKEALGLACEFFCTDNVVVRSSERNDYCGLIDAMPTEVGNLSEVDELIRRVKMKCRDSGIAAYSKQEGGYYDPEEVTLSVSPLLTIGERTVVRGLVTEHPNLPGVSCVDLKYGGINHAESGDSFSCDFLYDRALPVVDICGFKPFANKDSLEAEAREGLALSNLIRAAGVFPSDKALQYEFVKWNRNNRKKEGGEFRGEKKEGVFLTQVKFFADKRPARCSTADMEKVFDQRNSRGFRNFGITPPEGIVLPCVHGKKSRDDFRRFEEKHPGVPYAAYLELGVLTQPLSLSDCLPRMMAHLPVPKASIDHAQFRPAMRALKNGGVSLFYNVCVMDCDGADRVRIVADGLNASVEAV